MTKDSKKQIIIKGAKEHNLQNIDLAIPRGADQGDWFLSLQFQQKQQYRYVWDFRWTLRRRSA